MVNLSKNKACTILLLLLFFFDIFFVNVTPLFTKSGNSVMGELATAGNIGKLMPSLFQVRDIGLNPYGACFQAFALLGLGDIVMPAYAIGIFLSNLAVSFSFTEQPALLFLVPSVLLPVVLLGWYRGELGTLWYGLEVIKRTYGRRVNNTDGQNTKNDNLPLDQQTEAT
ncbi:unnamed protein product [Larinioides sclopetarius]|uniref:Uncharacterized protein n=1 Tax=Larinioides sclopetarius TaxID=280406 RepID=A0AAV2B3I1_9ARAC